jgi:hypothetical protein
VSLRGVVAPFGCWIAAAAVAAAQAISGSQVQGTVVDATGAALPGVAVTITQTATGLVRTTTSDTEGRYLFQALPVGPYRLEAALDGFRPYVQTGIVLQVNVNPTIPIRMELGALAEAIRVEAASVLVETQTTGIGQVIDQERIEELPLIDRDVTRLIMFTGAAVEGRGTRTNYPGTAFPALAGGNTGSVAFAVDGGTHNDPLNNGNLPLPFPDALQEFKVETSAVPAMYGYHSSGAVNAVTKSGANQVAGAAFEYWRNDRFNAAPTFATIDPATGKKVKADLNRHQIGGTLGGPLVRDRLFYFAGYQGTIQRSVSQTTSIVPTAAMLRGDFTAVASAACRTQGALTLPAALGFTGNRIDPARLNPIAVDVANRFLPVAQADECGRVTYSRHQPSANPTEHQAIGRIDFQLSQRQNLFVRFYNTHLEQPTGNPDENILELSVTGQGSNVASAVVGHTLAGRQWVSQLRVTGNRNSQTIKVPSYFTWTDVGVRVNVEDEPKYVGGMNVTGAFNIGSTASRQPYQTLQVSEDISWLPGGGGHQINFGASWIDLRAYALNKLNRNGSFTFNGTQSQAGGLALVDFLVGRPASFVQAAPVPSNQTQTVFGLYLQDVWRATAKWTINAGLRWDPVFAHRQPLDVAYYLSEEAIVDNVRSTRFSNAPAGTLFRGDPGGPEGKGYWNDDLLNFSPRVGLVFDPAGNGQMAIRASYGLTNEIPSFAFDQFGFARPLGGSITISPTSANPIIPFDDPWSVFPGGNPFPQLVSDLSPGAIWIPRLLGLSYKPDTRNPYIHQWNVAVERSLGRSWLVSASYLGNRTIHLWTDRPANYSLPLAVTGPCVIHGQTLNPCAANPVTEAPLNVDARRRWNLLNPVAGPFYANVGVLDDGGTAYYNGLVLSARGRWGGILNGTANYTWAECISDPGTLAVGLSLYQYSQPDNREADRGICPAHRNKVFNFTLIGAVPELSNRTMQLLAGGWRLAMSGRIQSGTWFSALAGTDRALSSTPNQRAVQVLDDPYAADKSEDQWLNPAAFRLPALGTFSDLGVNTLLGPKNIQVDLAVTRQIPVGAGRIELRAEVFNFLNITNLQNPISALNNPNFGKIRVGATGQMGDARLAQFALRYEF